MKKHIPLLIILFGFFSISCEKPDNKEEDVKYDGYLTLKYNETLAIPNSNGEAKISFINAFCGCETCWTRWVHADLLVTGKEKTATIRLLIDDCYYESDIGNLIDTLGYNIGNSIDTLGYRLKLNRLNMPGHELNKAEAKIKITEL